jgi:carboxyl-terminal processing protease
VVAPLPDTPASRAGIRAGDAVLKIDGEETLGLSLDAAVSKIRGPKGTAVTLTVLHAGDQDAVDVRIVRDQIVVSSVKWTMVDDAGKETDRSGGWALISVSQFNEDAVPLFDSAIRALELRDAKGVIVDLRGNPGGYLESAVEMARYWAGGDTVVVQKRSDGTEESFAPTMKSAKVGLPTIVLVNGGSASASEILAGALQDYGLATLVGEKTFGKGSVQSYFNEFPDGSALKITTALWYTPKMRSIDKTGIAPDVEVKMTPDDVKAGKDPQLEKAIELFKGQR